MANAAERTRARGWGLIGWALCACVLIAPVSPAAAATLRPGDILVADRDSLDGSGAVIKVDPATGRQSLVSSNAISGGPDLFVQPQEIALSATGRILVTDAQSGDGGAVIAVDPATGEQRLVSDNTVSGPDLFSNPHRLVLTAAGRILVTDEESEDGFGAVIAVDPATGRQRAVSSNTISGPDLFDAPDGIAVTQTGRILVADRESEDGLGAVVDVDPTTGEQSALSNNTISGTDLLMRPNGIALTPARTILLADIVANAVIAVHPATGEQRLVSNNTISGPDLLSNPTGIRFTAAGRILVADNTSEDGSGAVIAVDPATGRQAAVSNNTISGPDLFEGPSGLLVVPPRCFGRFATIVGDPSRNVLRGTRFADVIVGLGGRDRINGRGGADRICGGKGPDRLLGGRGNDRLLGAGGRDRLLGGRGRDRLLGAGGNDRLIGGPGRDRLRGGPGRDRQRQ